MKYQVSFCTKTWYLHMWKQHVIFTCENNYNHCYGYIINRTFHTKKLLKWNGLVVHWSLYNKIEHYMAAWRYKISLMTCWKNISFVRCAHSWNIFQHSKRNLVSPHSHVISSIYSTQGLVSAWVVQRKMG